MIVVTAPTGDIGHKVLATLLDNDAPIRVIVRDPSWVDQTILAEIQNPIHAPHQQHCACHRRHQRHRLSGLHESIDEAIGLALDRGIEHLDRMRIALVRKH